MGKRRFLQAFKSTVTAAFQGGYGSAGSGAGIAEWGSSKMFPPAGDLGPSIWI